jgi:hypothetical protein
VAQALLFGDNEHAIEATLELLDQDAFSNQRYITEYPILTALSRTQNPSELTLNRLKSYILEKPNSPYLKKLFLVYSSLVRIYCQRKGCSENQLVIF